MGKYLELFRGEVGDLTEKTKLENKPYVCYSTKLGKVTYTVVPKLVVGLADNEIWYTSTDGNVVTPYNTGAFEANIVSNTYKNGKGVIKFDNSVTKIGLEAFFRCSSLTSITITNSVTVISTDAFSGCSSLTSISFEGTAEQWNNIYKGLDWSNEVPATYVQCTDGQAPLYPI